MLNAINRSYIVQKTKTDIEKLLPLGAPIGMMDVDAKPKGAAIKGVCLYGPLSSLHLFEAVAMDDMIAVAQDLLFLAQ